MGRQELLRAGVKDEAFVSRHAVGKELAASTFFFDDHVVGVCGVVVEEDELFDRG